MNIERIYTEQAPPPIAPFCHATRCGDWIFVTGQMPIVASTREWVRGSCAEQTRAVMSNLDAVLKAAGSDWNHVLHARLYLTDFEKYDEVNAAYAAWFDGEFPARTCIGVTALAGGADVEIDLLAVRA